MAVLSLQWLVAVSAWLPAVAAGVGPEREQPNPWGAVQTPGPNLNMKEADVHIVPRVMTAGPAARGVPILPPNPPESSESSYSSESDDPGSSTSDAEESKTQAPAEATTTDAANPPAENSSSTPVGPIVGGVVGGVAALGLIGLGIFFLIRQKNKNASESPPPIAMSAVAPAPSGPGFMPPPGQSPYPNQAPPPNMSPMSGATAAGPYDPRYSMIKPPMATSVSPMQGEPMNTMGAYPVNSPPPEMFYPGMQQPGMGMGPPPPHQGMGMGTPLPPMMNMAPTPSPPPPQPYVPPPQPYGPSQGQYQAYHPQPMELPTQRGDGQAHELS
ncbi:hypothetical protein N0V88_007611 [Collariella sp. IMI 366227]|nr:hypothetical protein N0V88_007611 [Collariella sp. IMI 366227]